MKYNMHEAKSKLSQLVEQAQRGEEVIIAKAGIPVVSVHPYLERKTRKPGVLKAHIKISEHFDSAQINHSISKAFNLK